MWYIAKHSIIKPLNHLLFDKKQRFTSVIPCWWIFKWNVKFNKKKHKAATSIRYWLNGESGWKYGLKIKRLMMSVISKIVTFFFFYIFYEEKIVCKKPGMCFKKINHFSLLTAVCNFCTRPFSKWVCSVLHIHHICTSQASFIEINWNVNDSLRVL